MIHRIFLQKSTVFSTIPIEAFRYKVKLWKMFVADLYFLSFIKPTRDVRKKKCHDHVAFTKPLSQMATHVNIS